MVDQCLIATTALHAFQRKVKQATSSFHRKFKP
jgi:hypothetical protein